MSDHKQLLREFFSPIQHRRLVNFLRAVREFWTGWMK